MANQALRWAGVEARIDHRSYEAQGVDRVPGVHLGPDVVVMEEKGIRTDRGRMALERERLRDGRDRADQIRAVEGRISRGRGAGGITAGFDRRRDASQGKSAVGGSGGLWGRFKARRAPEQPETITGASMGVYWAVRRLLGERSGWDSSTAGLAALARRFQFLGQQRRAAEDRARRAEMAIRHKPLSAAHTRAKGNPRPTHGMEKPNQPKPGRRR